MRSKLDHLPQPSSDRIAIRINALAERKIRQGHPWLFDQSILKISHGGSPGDLAVIFDQDRNFLAIGLFDPYSSIRVRILQHRKPILIDQKFFKNRLLDARKIRNCLPQDTTGYRLVHGENDRLPGLVIDRYDQTLVMKLYTVAWLPHLQDILNALHNIEGFNRIILRLSRSVQKSNYLFGLQDGDLLFGPPIEKPLIFLENGISFEVDPILGHKTGFYLDQRENRKLVENLASGKSVLNLFSYTGAFSVYAAVGGAHEVRSIDISQQALKVAVRNFNHNSTAVNLQSCIHKITAGDSFTELEKLARQNCKFDMVIIDPPSFAKSQAEISKALSAYQRLTRLALNVLLPFGTLVQASCSSRVSSDHFYDAIHQAAIKIGRPLTEFNRTSHPLDHPIGFKEGSYLKCMFAIG